MVIKFFYTNDLYFNINKGMIGTNNYFCFISLFFPGIGPGMELVFFMFLSSRVPETILFFLSWEFWPIFLKFSNFLHFPALFHIFYGSPPHPPAQCQFVDYFSFFDVSFGLVESMLVTGFLHQFHSNPEPISISWAVGWNLMRAHKTLHN